MVIQYKSPCRKEFNKINITGFKLESEPKASCYICHAPLSNEEKKHKSTFIYKDTDGNELGKVETYVCFDCIKVITEGKEICVKE